MKSRILVLVILAISSNQVGAETKKITMNGVIACKSKSTFDRIIELNSSDKQAASKLAVDSQARGECRTILVDTEVFSERSDDYMACYRPKGETVCLWTITAAAR